MKQNITNEEANRYFEYQAKRRSILFSRKHFLVLLIFGMLLIGTGIRVASYDDEAIRYRIYFDSNDDEYDQMKDALQSAYEELCEGLDASSEKTMIRRHLDVFEQIKEDVNATWKHNRLNIKIGDGKGEMISASFTKPIHCIEEVKPRSLLADFFG